MTVCLACGVTLEPELSDLSTGHTFTTRRSAAQTMRLTAAMELPAGETKTALDDNSVVWKTGDQIKVFSASYPSGVVFTLDPVSNGQRQGDFVGDLLLGSGPYYAVYPASVATSLSGGSVSVTVPHTQALTAGSFGPGANISLAKVNSLSETLGFKNVLGALKISLNGSLDAARIRIQTKSAESLCGSASLTMEGDVPALSFASNAVENQWVEASGKASGTDFYVMLPAGTLAGGFVAQVAAGDGYCMVKQTSANNSVPRSGIRAMPAFDYEAQFQASFLDISAFPYGFFTDIQAGGTPTALFSFSKATSQYASKVAEGTSRTFRIQDFLARKMYSIELPFTLSLGNVYDATVESVVGTEYMAPAQAGSFLLVQRSANAGWFVKDDYSCGFIFLMED